MGLLDRIGKVGSGLLGTIQAPFGLVKDLAVGAFTDDEEFDGFVGTLYGSFQKRGGQALGGVFGPEQGLGAAIGGLPGYARKPVRAVTDPIFEGLETAGREAIREPLAAGVTVLSQAQRGKIDFGEAYRTAQTRSLGQSGALLLLSTDITDEADLAEAQGSDWYESISGTLDATARMILEPDVLVGGGVGKARKAGAASKMTQRLSKVPGAAGLVEKGTFGRSIRTNADKEAALAHPALGVINEQIGRIKAEAGDVDQAAARIRDLAFHDHRDGAFISRVLAEADAEDLDNGVTWGALMGHKPSVDALAAKKADVAGELSRLQGTQAQISSLKRMGFELPDEVKAVERAELDAEIGARYDIEARLTHAEQANRMVREIPRISGLSEKRASFVRGSFFQEHWAAAPVRMAVNMQPRNMVDLHDAAGDIQVARILRKAKVPLELQDELRGQYMAAADPTARGKILEQAQAVAIRSMAERYGITDMADIDAAINAAQGLSWQARDEMLKSRVYDGKGRSQIVHTDDAGTTHINVPLSVTQELNTFLVPNLDKVDDALKEAANISKRFNIPMADIFSGAAKGSEELLTRFNQVWKPSVLFRVGWPIRVVGEEQLRIASQIGALLTAGRTIKAAGRFGKDLSADAVIHAHQALRKVPRTERILRDPVRAQQRGARFGTFEHRGVDIEKAYGTMETMRLQWQALNSAKPTMESMMTNADTIRGKLRAEATGEWVSLEPTNAAWGGSWENAVNNQMGKDTVWRQFLEGKSIDEVRDWIDNTPEGRAYLQRLPHWKNNVDEWLEFMQQTADDYLPFDELKAMALEGKARTGDIERLIPDAGARPLVHGAALADVSGKTAMAQWVGKNIRDRGMRWMGTIPTDVLSRNNYFDFLYTNEIKRLVDLELDQGGALTSELVGTLEDKARNFALGESKRLLYDLAESSELAHTLRFIMPFYGAWQEVLTRWTGITLDNPAFVARMHQVWRSPEKAGIVVDEDGNTIHEDGTATSPLGEKVEAGKERYLNMRLLADENVIGKGLFNDLTRNVPGVRRLENARFAKDGFNTILQGAPGFGPIIQMPVNEIAKGRPDLEDSLKWALPFGATQSTLQMLLPATARRAQTLSRGEEDRLYRNQLVRIYFDMQVDFNLGKSTEEPSYAEAKKRTDSFYRMRTVASFVSPVAPSFVSPYQLHIDAYRALKTREAELDKTDPGHRNRPDYRSPDEIFLESYGEEFFPLTQSLSKTMDGIPPTLEGAAARKKYQDMIERHPELGGLIVGAEGSGEFSAAVYQSQLQQSLSPGSPDKQRESFAPEEAFGKPNERLGWMEYSKAMDLIDAERMNRGLPNLQVRQAQDLANLKRAVITNLEKKYPEWAEKFNITDRGAWKRRIDGMRDIAGDERLAGRAEIQVLGQYLETRDQVIGILAARKAAGGASTLNAASNMDVKGVWDQITGKLTQNPAFASVFYRWLERDPLDADTLREVS